MRIKTITESSGIVVRRILYNPAAIYIQYPNGDIWEYVIYNNKTLRDIIKKYRFNMGRLSSAVKNATSTSDARIVGEDEFNGRRDSANLS